jgi:NAD(P)-dependent dehydrogenase (short-subunit alcohol dehydrogenase family)
MSGSLNGRRALVTAGASGIGRVIAAQLTEAGARCRVCDVDAAALDEYASAFGASLAVRADVADETQVDALFAEVKRQLGGLDILINNAGISGPTLPAEELSLDDWQRTLAVNLDGHFLCARRAIPLLRAAGGGSIVNMSSLTALSPAPGAGAYNAAKAGVLGLTLHQAVEWGPHAIRANAVLPGLIPGTRLTPAGGGSEELRARRGAVLPLRRVGTPEDVARVVVFFLSDLAAYVTGQFLCVDGGFGLALQTLLPS